MSQFSEHDNDDSVRSGIDPDGGMAFLSLAAGIVFGYTFWFGFFIIGILIAAWLTIAER